MEDRREEYDPAALLTRAALFFVAALIIFVSAIISIQIWKTGEANTESWAALTGIIGWVTGIASVIFNARFGTSQQSAAKDRTIAKQAETAAVAQAALAPLAAAANGAVTPAPKNPETGAIPAKEVATDPPTKGPT